MYGYDVIASVKTLIFKIHRKATTGTNHMPIPRLCEPQKKKENLYSLQQNLENIQNIIRIKHNYARK